VLGRKLVVVFNPLCPVRFSLLLYCIYFCFSVPNKTISISISKLSVCYVMCGQCNWLIRLCLIRLPCDIKTAKRIFRHLQPKKVHGYQKNFHYISRICREASRGRICMKFGTGCPFADVIICVKFLGDWFRGRFCDGVEFRLPPLT